MKYEDTTLYRELLDGHVPIWWRSVACSIPGKATIAYCYYLAYCRYHLHRAEQGDSHYCRIGYEPSMALRLSIRIIAQDENVRSHMSKSSYLYVVAYSMRYDCMELVEGQVRSSSA